MDIRNRLHRHLAETCESIYETRLDAVMDVAFALQKSNDLSLTRMGRNLPGNIDVKHKIKKVDRLEGNKYLHNELHQLYIGLSQYVFSLLSFDKSIPLVVDLCFVKDEMQVQMLSAEVVTKGRTIPIYREIFNEGQLSGRADTFLKNLSKCIPQDKKVVIIMDAGFFEDWFTAIESHNWYWICRTREGKSIKLSDTHDWISIKNFIPGIGVKSKNHNNVLLTRKHKHLCRIVTTRKPIKSKRKHYPPSVEKRRKIASGNFRKAAIEPWILATNLPVEYNATKVINLYHKRMQIEESFRDMKSHQFGLSGRYIRTTCANRWGVKMLLAAIVQIIYWILGVIAHSQGLQRLFQANTVKDKKVFSYFTLGRFILEFDKLKELKFNYKDLPQIMQKELANA